MTADIYREKHLAEPELNFFEKQNHYLAKAKTLNSILKDSNAPKVVDFFSLDVEGAEFSVLNGINFDEFNFKYILIETDEFERLKKFLEDKKYQFVKKFNFNDYLFRY